MGFLEPVSALVRIIFRRFKMTMDPVCEMEVDQRNASYVTTYEGRSYYFCSRECQMEFDQDPRRYVGPTEEVTITEPRYGEAHGPPKQKNSDQHPPLMR